jgi:hypothetical protein
MVHLVTEIDFVDGDNVLDEHVQGYEKDLADTIRKAAQGLSLRTVGNTQVRDVVVAEIKG